MSLTPYARQVAALPVKGKPGDYEALLITSRGTKRWIIPKGWPMKRRHDHDAAAQEAYEEAGVSGRVHKHPMGAYNYFKPDREVLEEIKVMVYLIEVDQVHVEWPEQQQRKRVWLTSSEAANRVGEPGLKEIIRRADIAPIDA